MTNAHVADLIVNDPSDSGSSMEAALAWAARGFRVLPLHAPISAGRCSCGKRIVESITDRRRECKGKHPRTDWQTGGPSQQATTNEGEIRRWFGRWPHANIGIALGSWLGDADYPYVLALDLDGLSARKALDQLGLPLTLTSMTRRGEHLIYKTDLPLTNAEGELATITDLDVRGVGGYIIAAGSRIPHPDGGFSGPTRYRLRDPSVPVAPLPASLRDALTHASPPKSSAARGVCRNRSRPSTHRLVLIPRSFSAQLADASLGRRSEAAFGVLRRLVKLRASDDAIFNTVWFTPIGARYRERGESSLWSDIARARTRAELDPEHARSRALSSALGKVYEHIDLADRFVINNGCRKLLRGHQALAIQRGGGKYAASVRDEEIAAGISSRSSLVRYRTTLLEQGWLRCVSKAGQGSSLASVYVLRVPQHLRGQKRNTTSTVERDGAVAGGVPTVSSPAPSTDIPADLDGCRYSITSTCWVVLRQLSVGEPVSRKTLAERLRRHPRTIRRNLARLQGRDEKESLIVETEDGISLVAEWADVLTRRAERYGATGTRQRQLDKHAQERRARANRDAAVERVLAGRRSQAPRGQ